MPAADDMNSGQPSNVFYWRFENAGIDLSVVSVIILLEIQVLQQQMGVVSNEEANNTDNRQSDV